VLQECTRRLFQGILNNCRQLSATWNFPDTTIKRALLGVLKHEDCCYQLKLLLILSFSRYIDKRIPYFWLLWAHDRTRCIWQSRLKKTIGMHGQQPMPYDSVLLSDTTPKPPFAKESGFQRPGLREADHNWAIASLQFFGGPFRHTNLSEDCLQTCLRENVDSDGSLESSETRTLRRRKQSRRMRSVKPQMSSKSKQMMQAATPAPRQAAAAAAVAAPRQARKTMSPTMSPTIRAPTKSPTSPRHKCTQTAAAAQFQSMVCLTFG